MAISFIGVEVSESASTTSLACSFHASTAVDDLLVALVYRDNNNGVIDIPSGWDEDPNAQIAATNDDDRRGTVFTKVANSSDVSAGTVSITHTWTVEQMSVHMVTVRGVDTGDIYDVTPTSDHYTVPPNTNAPDMPSITTVNDGAMVLTFWGCTASEVTTCAQPSGLTVSDVTTLTPGATFPQRQSFSAYEIVSTASEVSGQWTGTRSGVVTVESYLATISLKPDTGGGGTILPFIQAYYRGLN